MDPSQIQEDTSNDVHSLENDDTAAQPAGSKDSAQESANIIDANDGKATPPPAETPHNPSLIRRLWQKLNIYLLLFVALILIAVGAFVALYAKDRKQNNTDKSINSQNLSGDTLKQLANSDTTVGTPKQTLNVQSNAVFAGAVLVRSNVEVAGALKVGGNLSLPGITVSGSSQFSQLQADSLAIAGNANVQGTLTAKHGLNVIGDSTFSGGISAAQITTGALQLNGDLILTHHITAGGPIPNLARGSALGSGGTASVSGSDTAGSIAINTGSSPPAGCFATLTFTKAFASTPHVVVTPVGAAAAGLAFYVNRSTSSLSVCTATPAPAGQTLGFDYVVLD